MTTVVRSIQQWREIRSEELSQNTPSIGFVPTMGSLHVGHQSLLEQARQENDVLVLSIFVNPTQFNEAQDYQCYPRAIEEDIQLATSVGVDYVLIPEASEMYTDTQSFMILEEPVSQKLEGAFRPGHFEGVLTVVMKLLQLVKPQKAYFGEKDYQQYVLIKQMAEAFFLEVEVLASQTVRDSFGLPYSSRNLRLDDEGIKQAREFARIFHEEKSCEEISSLLEKAGITIDYVQDYAGRRYAAVWVGAVRLIDNYEV